MTDSAWPSTTRVGLVRLREHCTFTWRQAQDDKQRVLEVRSHHCSPCLAEARQLGYLLLRPDGVEVT